MVAYTVASVVPLGAGEVGCAAHDLRGERATQGTFRPRLKSKQGLAGLPAPGQPLQGTPG